MKKIFSSRLLELRGKLSQVQMARKIGVSQTSYSSWENGNKTPYAPVIIKLASTFGVSADWILGLTDTRDATIANPEVIQVQEAMKKEIKDLKKEILSLKGENAGLNRALELALKR